MYGERGGMARPQPATARRRSVSSSATTVLASAISPLEHHRHRVDQREVEQLHVVFLGTLAVEVDGRAVGGEEDRGHRIGHPRRRDRSRSAARDCRPTTRPPRSTRGAPPRSAPRPAMSRIPAGISMIGRSYGGRYCDTRTTDGLPSASNTSGTTPTAPGDRTMSRVKGSPSGSTKSATATLQTYP